MEAFVLSLPKSHAMLTGMDRARRVNAQKPRSIVGFGQMGELRAREQAIKAVSRLEADDTLASVSLDSKLIDMLSSDCFEHERVYRDIASDAGFDVTRTVRQTRCGRVHELLLVRQSPS